MKWYQKSSVRRWLALVPFAAAFSFSGLNLGQNDRLLFQVQSSHNGLNQSYKTLVLSDLGENSREILSFFPEKVIYGADSPVFLLQNRFGLFLGNQDGQSLKPLDFYPDFSNGNRLKLGRLNPVSLSPDGGFILYYKQSTLVQGQLILYDRGRDKEIVVTEEFEPDFGQPLVKWSPDSRFFCYSKEGNIYYFSISQYLEGRSLLETAHIIGQGSIHSFNWSSDNSLYYIQDRNIYRIHSAEIFALSFYDTPLQIGTVAGRLFVDFDPNRDRFWMSPSGSSLLIRKGEGNVFLYDTEFQDYNLNSEIRTLPFIKMPVGSTIKDVLWSKSGRIVILTENRLKQNQGSLVFLYDPDRDEDNILSMNQVGVQSIRLSPDEKYVSLVYEDHINIRSLNEWDLINEEKIPGILEHFWQEDNQILFFGDNVSGSWDYVSNRQEVLYISQPQKYGFNTDGEIQISTDQGYFIWNENEKIWESGSSQYFREARTSSPRFRIFKERVKSLLYDQMIMVRKIDGYGTFPLIDLEEPDWESYPKEEGSLGSYPGYFIHGSRIRRRELALVFNITSEDDGLMEVLNILSDYGIPATFFVNGDFIRKYPGALSILRQEGHEIGSLFYTNMDMTDRQYAIDEDFIIRGLARNEDEFYKATGGEIATIWHAPWYFVNSMIIEAGREINYTYVSRDIDSLDWVGVNDRDLYADSSELINRIMELKQPGSILSLSIGVEAQREDYLYQKLDLLINGLLNQGYDLVDVTTLMNNSR